MSVDTNKPIWQFELEAEERKKKQQRENKPSALDDLQTMLTGAGLSPLFGIIPDALNVLLSAIRGDVKGVAENVGSAIPGPIGYGVGGASLAKDLMKKKKQFPTEISSAQAFNFLKDV